MIFLDINTFYSPKAGGIRTYHQAKIAWFQQASEHEYFMVYPGPVYQEHKKGPTVTMVEAYGPSATADASGYRILLDYFRILALIHRVKPDILEAGDPWLTGLFCLALKKSGFFKGRLVSFYHSDPIPSYLMPWSNRGRFQAFKKMFTHWAGRAFYKLQNGYDLTIVSSKTMEGNLKNCGIDSIAYLPFGVPALFLTSLPERKRALEMTLPFDKTKPLDKTSPKVRLLYAGRLDREKGIELILACLPILLENENVEISVLGRGSFGKQFSDFMHPRFSFLGFKESQSEVRDIYDQHDILLAPGPYETFGLGVLEAMARGLIVVGPNEGGTGELLRQANSPYLFNAHDLNDFIRAAQAAIDGDWQSGSNQSRTLALKYGSWNDAVQRMVVHFDPAKAKS